MTQANASSPYVPEGMNPITTQTWVNGRHNVRCVKVIQETWDVRTFCFMSDQPVMFFFKPGQFVTLELMIEHELVMRSYTISSSPSVPYSFSITVKRVSGGHVSNWLHDNLKKGDQLAVHGPVGQFNIIDFPSDKTRTNKFLFLSGGVGITPVMSMTRWLMDTNADVDIDFIHSARSPHDIVYQNELQNMAARLDNFHLHLISETTGFGDSWSGYRGRFNGDMLRLMSPDFMQREIFCCGPTPYMAAVRELLKGAGFDMRYYHEESFGATPVEAEIEAVEQAEEAELAPADADLATCTISFLASGKSGETTRDETVHTAAIRLGLHIPKACGMGICGTCKVKKCAGNVEMNHNGGITEEEEAEGYILSCCSRPLGNVEIDY